MTDTTAAAATTPPTQPTPAAAEAPKQTPERPADSLIAGKFKSVEELEKAYKSLESQFHSTRSTPNDVSEVLERAGVRGDEIAANFGRDGRLTDEQYAALGKVGYSRKVVDDYLTGQFAVLATKKNAAQEVTQRVMQQVGGEAEWGHLTEWARSHYTPDQVAEINKRLAEASTAESAVKELLYDYRVVAGRGVRTPIVHGSAPPNTAAAMTTSEVIETMKRIDQQGYIDAATKARLARTPMHVFRGVNK